MSSYLSRLKQMENEKFSACAPDIQPSKPSKAPFEPFEGSSQEDISKNLFVNEGEQTVARVATVSVANPGEGETEEAANDTRQQRVEEMLTANPELKYAVVVDDTNADPVTVTVGIRKIAVFDLEIPRQSYNGMALLQIIEQYAEESGVRECGMGKAAGVHNKQ
jgi:hypothetical protein